jgi:hypothetical protein
MKYKIEFSGKAEMLFAVMAKLLPDELNVHVEEIPDEKPVQSVALPKTKPHLIEKPKRKGPKKGQALNPNSGVNAIILKMLSDGKNHYVTEAFPAMTESGFSTNGIYSRINRLVDHGYITKVATGIYKLNEFKLHSEQG